MVSGEGQAAGEGSGGEAGVLPLTLVFLGRALPPWCLEPVPANGGHQPPLLLEGYETSSVFSTSCPESFGQS